MCGRDAQQAFLCSCSSTAECLVWVIAACHGALPSNTGKVMRLTLACNLFWGIKVLLQPKLHLSTGTGRANASAVALLSFIQPPLKAAWGLADWFLLLNTILTSLNCLVFNHWFIHLLYQRLSKLCWAFCFRSNHFDFYCFKGIFDCFISHPP